MSESATRTNLKKARTGFRDESGPWYILDNAGTIMPSVSNSVSTSLFRVSAVIDEAVNLSALQDALERTAKRFPYFVVELRRGFFWYYLEPRDRPLRVEADAQSPCQDYNINRHGMCLFRVRASGRRIACEFSHALTDGTGGLRFLKNLLAEYLRIRSMTGRPTLPDAAAAALLDPDLYILGENAPPEEFEDAYNRYFDQEYPAPDKLPKAFHLRSSQLTRHQYRVTCGVIPLAEALAKAREMGVSLTELLAAAYLESFQAIWMSVPATKRKRQRPRISVEVPVNMRKFYPTDSNRNFSLFVLISQDMRLGARSFPEIATRVHHQLRFETDGRTIAQQISRNVSGTRSVLVRLTPLVVKDFFARLLFSALGDDLLSGFVSNIGPVSMPEEFAAHIERFDFIPAPSQFNMTSAAVLSYKGALHVNFGSLAQSREVERAFFTRLRSLGLPVRVECNLQAAEK